MPVYPDADGVISHIEINLTSADSITHGLSDLQFNWRPAPERWSIGQCLTHLNLINGADLPQLAAAIEAARKNGVTAQGPFQYGWLARKFVASMEPPVTRRFHAPKPYVPRPDVELEAALTEYRRVSNAIVELARIARGLDWSKVKTRLSGVPLIRMPLGARFSLLATHDTRHLWQAGQVLKDARFPK